jgi:osmotically-inducible protein OsmY
MNDYLVKNGIETFLRNHTLYNFSNVQIFVQQGVVLLVGTVLSKKEIDYIFSSVSRLPGVKRVICKLELKSEAVTAKLPFLATILGT